MISNNTRVQVGMLIPEVIYEIKKANIDLNLDKVSERILDPFFLSEKRVPEEAIMELLDIGEVRDDEYENGMIPRFDQEVISPMLDLYTKGRSSFACSGEIRR